jgi:hypothetical protein
MNGTLPPNAFIRGNNVSRFYESLVTSDNINFNYVSSKQIFMIILIISLTTIAYTLCVQCKASAANPLGQIKIPMRKRTNSQFKKIEMTSYPILRGLDSHDSIILSKKQTKLLQNILPLHLQMSDWSLLYASNRDGYNIETFHRLAEDNGPTILVIADTAGHVFGGFNSISWERPKSPSGHYFGTGESFVFTVLPAFKHYTWTGLNSEFVMTKSDCIAFGGGGKFAFTLDERFQRGSSDKSATYNNECLANSYMYDVVNVELWKFDRFT